ncbi:MAG: serine/threonine-protein kinase [Rhodothermales bacterium]
MSLQPGLARGYEIDGHRIEEALDQDVLGTLYLATDIGVQRPVALRVINPILAQDPIFVQQFQIEASRLAQLSHPNIVTIYDIRDTNQATYISMEYVESETLSAYLDQVKGPRWRLGVPLLQQVLEALDYAHRLGILHESLKPDRILVTEDGRVKLKDFGISRMLKKVSLLPLSYNDSDIRGYPSPEQLDSQARVDERSDVYSIGLILYEILTGTLPFDKLAPDFVVRNTLNDAMIQNPARLNPNVPRRLAQITMKALRKQPGDRYQTVREMLQDLTEADRSHSQPTRPPRHNRLRSTLRRMVTPVAAAYTFVGLLFATGSLYAFQQPDADPFKILSVDGPAMAAAAVPRPLPPPERPPRTAVVDPAQGPVLPFDPPADPIPPDPVPANLPAMDPQATTAPTAPVVAPVAPPPADPVVAPLPAGNPVALASPADPVPADPRPVNPAPAAAAQPRKPAVGWLAITSRPAGAVVLINGKLSGKTPKNGAALPPGPATVALTLEGYEAVTTDIDISAGQTLPIDQTLKPRDGAIKLHITPRGDVYLDDELVIPRAEGLHTLMASPDSHLVTVQHPAFGKWQRMLLPRYNEDQHFTIDFTRDATVDINSFDEDGSFVIGEIWIDGKATGQYTPMTIQTPVGVRSIDVRADGYRMLRPMRVNVDGTGQDVVEIILERVSAADVH